jgi:hypothetical protein
MTHQAVADHFNVSRITICRGIDVLVKIQIFRMANYLLLLTAQLMTAGDLNA